MKFLVKYLNPGKKCDKHYIYTKHNTTMQLNTRLNQRDQ